MRGLPLLHETFGLNLHEFLETQYASDVFAVAQPDAQQPASTSHDAPEIALAQSTGGVTTKSSSGGGIQLHSTTGGATPLQLSIRDSGSYGNNFAGSSDADGIVNASFAGTGQDLLLSLNGYDIDTGDEVEVLLNGNSLGFLSAGANNGLSSHQFQISAAQQQEGENVISFVQRGDVNWTWGVTDILLEPAGPAAALEIGVTDSGSYGNNFAGMSDADGVVSASFTSTGQGLLLTFDGFDIDTADEVEVLVNGNSIGFIEAGADGGVSSHQFFVPAEKQQAGENVISFVQRGDVNWTWGVKNILLNEHTPDPATPLELGVVETSAHGNNFNGSSDVDGRVDTSFISTGQDLLLTFNGYDIDTGDEVEVLLNGTSLGFLDAGGNNGLTPYLFQIPAGQQQAGENTLSFVQRGDPKWTWGVSDILLEPAGTAMTLEIGVADGGSYGNNFAGQSDSNGVVSASFTGSSQDLVLSFEGYDIDTSAEVEVLVNGTSLGFLEAGADSALSSYQFFVSAEKQQAGENVVSFVQRGDVAWTWGVKNVMLTEHEPGPAIALQPGVMESGAYGNNFNGSSDIDGRVDSIFTGTGEDLLLTFKAYDIDAGVIDSGDQVEVLLNGTSLGLLEAGQNNALSAYQFHISAEQQQEGENVLSFVQQGDVRWTWGVTDILLEATGPATSLEIGMTDDGIYGNNFAGTTDKDGVIDASFISSGEDLVLTFDAYDNDVANEIEVLVNESSLGFLELGADGELSSHQFFLSAEQQQDGKNVISFVQAGDVNWTWGVTNILLTEHQPDPVISLEPGVTETGSYGNNFNGSSDLDGRVEAVFEDTGDDLLLTFEGYDIDSADEVEVLLNGTSLGFLAAGSNEGMSSYEFQISASQQQAGENVISFVQRGDPKWTWGVTNIRIGAEPPIFTPSDSLYAAQWHLQEIGHLERVWVDYTGEGISVAVYDDGVQYAHHDLDGNYDASKHVVVDGQVVDAAEGDADHGTAVAGVIAAEEDGAGTVGVAFDAKLTGVNIFSGPASANNPSGDVTGFGEAMAQMADFDIANHSWGWSPPFVLVDPPQVDFYPTALPTLENAAENGREGLGTVIIKAAGNSSGSAQGDLLDSSRFTISVGATDNDGDIAWYSNQGANLLVTAPSSGDAFFNSGVPTTDLLGTSGYSFGDYTGSDGFTGFGGTSSAAPVVSGVTALMLDANPELGWRDVQTILAYSATHAGTAINLDPPFYSSEEHTWRFNAADNWNGGGLHISEDYGFGDVDAYSAVRMAEVWHLFGTAQTSANEAQVTISAAPNLSIGTGATIDLDLSGVALNVESAQVSISLSDSTVDIFLTSAEGTRVELYSAGDAPAGVLDWTFGAQLFRGEDADGIWSLEIVNAEADNAVLLDYTVDLWGSADGFNGFDAANDTYHFTDEIFAENIFDISTGQMTAIADDPARTLLTDSDGGIDWLDMAAMTGDLNVSLADNGTGTAAGQYFLTVAAGADIENAIGGDGYDRLYGNDLDNVLMGMRGNDRLYGKNGDDQLNGGDGCDKLYGGEGEDQLSGGAGNDQLWGGEGSDVFSFEDGFGMDVIYDFSASSSCDPNCDVIDFRNLGEATDFDQVMAAMSNGCEIAVYDLDDDGENVIVFRGMSVSDFSASDFLFV